MVFSDFSWNSEVSGSFGFERVKDEQECMFSTVCVNVGKSTTISVKQQLVCEIL